MFFFLMADDFNYWTSKNGYYPHAKTPNLDRLADMGVFFREAQCSSPVCNPSRNAIWSGLRPSTTGIDGNEDGFVREKSGFENIVTMNQYFMQNGYWVYGAGKLYHPKMSKSNHETDPENWSYINENGHGCNGGALYEFCNAAKDNYCFSANPNAMTRGNCNDYNLSNDIKELLESYPTSENKDKPFFIACGVFRPHMPWNSPLSFWELFDYDALEKPAGYNSALDDPGSNVHKQFVSRGKWMRAIQAYLASCALADYNVGTMLDALLASPYRDNTIVVFCGDHGWNLGEKGRWGKFDRCDEANHTTLIIYDPSAEGNGQECVKPVSLQDLYPTLIELCGLPERKNVEGNSLKPLLDKPDDPEVDAFALMMYGGKHYIKTEKWRFIDNGAESKLHDNANDPYQWHNLYGKSEYDGLVNLLRQKIDSVIAIGSDIKTNYYAWMPPIKPSAFLAEPISESSIFVKWNDVAENELGYCIYRRADVEDNFTLLQSLVANTESFLDETVSKNHSYSYFVEVYNSNDTLFTDTIIGIQPKNVAPATPTNLVATPISSTQIDLDWTDNALNETSYKVYRKSDDDDRFIIIASLDANVISYSDTSLDSSEVYAYYVEAINEIGASKSETINNVQAFNITYTGVAYENFPWNMSGSTVLAWKYDKVGSGSDWKADSSVTIGLYNTLNSSAGQDKRSYGECPYSAARWNGGSVTMRENGQWLRYTCSFEAGNYELKIRGRKVSKSIRLTLKSTQSLKSIFTTTLNYPGDFDELGEGGDGSGVSYWYKYKTIIPVDAGTYVVEFDMESTSGQGVFGEFSFIKTTTNKHSSVANEPSRILLSNCVSHGYIDLDLTEMNPAVWVKMFDLQAKLVMEKLVGGEEYVTIELDPNLPKGFYVLCIDDSNFRIAEKLILK